MTHEILDGLAENDPHARRARRDLRRVNRFMGTRSILMRAMQPAAEGHDRTLRVLELGAGDGSLMLRIAQRMAPSWPAVELTLLDRQSLLETATRAAYAKLGWSLQTLALDVLDWCSAPTSSDPFPQWDVIVTNLFLHHFSAAQLPALLSGIRARCTLFAACEPRRAIVALIGSHLTGAIGASALTRHDAVLSVHAGFRAHELSAVWPDEHREWRLQERRAGLFCHLFRARRLAAGPA
ncbi:MAG TPA: class I SAM-dependent methyltransferase [Steroidobacteraceae bacterium]|nr:class I SAM-dependent methyltransferase [Steroidobacteraceae bacterium]